MSYPFSARCIGIDPETQTAPQTLQTKPDEHHPDYRLPFVDSGSHWSVPDTGDYGGGVLTGEALAHVYAKHLFRYGPGDLGLLQQIVVDMIGEPLEALSPSRYGQFVGFLIEIENILRHPANCTCVDTATLVKLANLGLAHRKEHEPD